MFFPSKVNFERLGRGAFYLSSIDHMWRREYARYTGKIIQERVPFEDSYS